MDLFELYESMSPADESYVALSDCINLALFNAHSSLFGIATRRRSIH